jgi:hypothetical protein
MCGEEEEEDTEEEEQRQLYPIDYVCEDLD